MVVERRVCGLWRRAARAQQLIAEAAKRRKAAAAEHAVLNLILLDSGEHLIGARVLLEVLWRLADVVLFALLAYYRRKDAKIGAEAAKSSHMAEGNPLSVLMECLLRHRGEDEADCKYAAKQDKLVCTWQYIARWTAATRSASVTRCTRCSTRPTSVCASGAVVLD